MAHPRPAAESRRFSGGLRSALRAWPLQVLLVLPLGLPLIGCDLHEPVVPPFFLGEEELSVMEEVVAQHLRGGQEASLEGSPSERQASFARLCELYHAYDLLAPARACYSRLLSEDPRPKWRYLLGHVQLKALQPEAAIADFVAVFAAVPRHWSAVSLARARAANDELEEAARIYREALQFEDSPLANYELGQLLVELGQSAEAERHLRRALELAPQATVIHRALAAALAARGDGEGARQAAAMAGDEPVPWEDALLAAVRDQRRGSVAAAENGLRAFEQGDYEAAVRLFRQGMSSQEEPSLRSVRNLAEALRRTGRYEEAIELLRPAQAENPEDSAVAFELGLALRLAGRLSEARAVWSRALEDAAPGSSTQLDLLVALASLLLDCWEPALAQALYLEVLTVSPERRAALMGAALASGLGGDAPTYRRLHERLSAYPAPLGGRAFDLEARVLLRGPEAVRQADLAALQRSVVQRAREHLEQRNELWAYETLAFALAEAGDFAEAERLQGAAVAAARQGGQGELAARLEQDRLSFSRQQRVANPWATFGVSLVADSAECS